MQRGEAHRALVAELAVRARVVVVLAEVGDDHPSLRLCPELLLAEALVAEPPMEALDEAVLSGTARIDVDRLDLVVGQPTLDFLGDELRSIVATQERRCAMDFDRLLQPSEHVGGTHGAVRPQDVALAGVFIEDG